MALDGAVEKDQAIACFEHAKTYPDENVGILYQLGLLYLETGEHDQAVMQWDKAINMDLKIAGAGFLIKKIQQVISIVPV